MKTNLTKRISVLLLCIFLLFIITSCGDDSTEDTQGPSYDEANIITKTVKLYQTADETTDVKAAYYEGTPEILLIDTETMCKDFLDKYLTSVGPYTYSETDTTLTITRSNGSSCTIDFENDTMYFDNFDKFTAFGSGNIADMLCSTYTDEDGNSFYFQRTDSLTIDGLPLTIDFASRNIPLDICEGKKYIPFQTFNDIFLSPHLYNFTYNGQDLFFAAGGRVDASVTDKYYSIGYKERSEALINFTVNELCLYLDLYYGLQSEHGVTYGFEVFIEHANLWDDFNSPDAKKSSAALAALMINYLADKHSFFNMTSPYTGSAEADYIKSNSYAKRYYQYDRDILAARKECMPDGVEGYLEVGNTAYITFDAFTYSETRHQDKYDEASRDQSDTFGLIIYAHSQITRENSPIENVVLDLSCNGGGAVDPAIYTVAWMLGYCDLHITNPITGGYATTSYKVDVNLDGKFDENDTIADKNLYCLISPSSFSCGNLVPSLLKESERVTMLGGTSGGGACSVQFATLADGSIFQISSPSHLCVVSNGAYYTIDRGVEPHHFFGKFESYFNRETLTDFINSLK